MDNPFDSVYGRVSGAQVVDVSPDMSQEADAKKGGASKSKHLAKSGVVYQNRRRQSRLRGMRDSASSQRSVMSAVEESTASL
jgi:hypothetical protein